MRRFMCAVLGPKPFSAEFSGILRKNIVFFN